jgi:hypothetical protein
MLSLVAPGGPLSVLQELIAAGRLDDNLLLR